MVEEPSNFTFTIIQSNKLSRETRRSAKPLLRKGIMATWHQRMAHAHKEALQHLPEATTGIQITNINTYQGEKSLCKDCKITHVIKQTSRRLMITATEPFERVHFNLINMEHGLNEDRWVTHFYDEATRMHAVYTHRVKNDCVNAV